MRVKTLTLTTASAAALTIGLASPALALASVGDLEATHYQTLGGVHQGALHAGAQHQVMLPLGDDDDDEGDDDGDDDGGTAEIGGAHHAKHFKGPRGLCGIGGHIGGFAHGCGEDDDDDDDGGHGDHASEDISNCCGGGGGHVEGRVRMRAPRVVVRREVQRVPSGAVRSGFGGSQGSSAPLGIAGLSLMLGGAGLVPLARRRMRASGRS